MLSVASVYNGSFIPCRVLIKPHFLSYCIFNENCWVILPQSACGSNLFRLSLCVFLSRDSEGRKLCKKVKVDPSSRAGGAELLHYKSVAANPFPFDLSFLLSCLTLAHLLTLECKNHCAAAFSRVTTERSALCVFQRRDISHRVQQTSNLQGIQFSISSLFTLS